VDTSLPPDLIERVRALEARLENQERAQNPASPKIFDLNDVTGMPGVTGQTLIYNRDTGTWEPGLPDAFEAGDIKWSAATFAPSGRWIGADGAAVSRTTYADLFTAIGTTYGAGNGSTTFNVPNLLGKFVQGAGGPSLGATGGSANSITVSHTHTGPDHTHTGPSHQHAQNVSAGFTGGSGVRTDYDTDFSGAAAFPQGINTDAAGTGATGSGGTGATGSSGSSGTNANLPPYIALWPYIRY
jgi:microcystin-dependent protein